MRRHYNRRWFLLVKFWLCEFGRTVGMLWAWLRDSKLGQILLEIKAKIVIYDQARVNGRNVSSCNAQNISHLLSSNAPTSTRWPHFFYFGARNICSNLQCVQKICLILKYIHMKYAIAICLTLSILFKFGRNIYIYIFVVKFV